MKKLLAIAFLMCLTTTYVNTTEAQTPVKEGKAQEVQAKQDAMRRHRERAFEQRLGLTEVQKLKAREIRMNGHENIRPVINSILYKKQEAEMIRRSRMAVQMQEEKLAEIDKELAVLEKKAQAIRKQNMKEFESILTWKQKRILKEMKKEGRKKYHQEHPVQRPLMMPQAKQK